jgi:hypothetical protein
MGDQNRGPAEGSHDLAEEHSQAVARLGIDCGEWFIKEQHPRLQHQRSGKSHALALSPAELCCLAMAEIGKADL